MCLSIKVRHPEVVLSEGVHAGHEFVIVYNQLGYRCGYIRVAKGHPWHGLDYNDVPASCHGGLTFGEPDLPCDKGGPDDAYWFGFDCAHSGDAPDPELQKKATKGSFRMPGTVRTQAYVEEQCRSLCEQAFNALGKPIV